MAKTNDIAAQKQRQQKIILIVLGVVLLGVAALQGPKLLGGSDTPAPAAAPAARVRPSYPAAPARRRRARPRRRPSSRPVCRVRCSSASPSAGGALLKPGEGQLRAFTLFTAKDPFVQTLPKEPTTATPAAPADVRRLAAGSGGKDGGGSEGGGSTAPAAAPPDLRHHRGQR